MNFIERKKRLDYFLEMIEKGRCVSIKETSKKFNCSESTIKRMIAHLKQEGHNIEYCKNSKKIVTIQPKSKKSL